MRVPDHPPKPIPEVRTLAEYVAASLQVTSFCSSGAGHSHVLDLPRLIDQLGPDAELDYALKVAQYCPTCGAPGGGVKIEQR
jgi:hypothetical protein